MSHKRLLTSEEIEDIISFITPQPGIPKDSAESVVNINKNRFRAQLIDKEIYPELIPQLKVEMEKFYTSTLIQPGECVGIITAQSIGERQTQSNLNSVDWTDKVLYKNGDSVIVEPIGQMIDRLIDENKQTVKNMNGTTEYLPLKSGYVIPSCDENGFVEWLRIEAVTRHPPTGKLVKVVTQSGRTVTASQCKSFLTWNGSTFESTLGSDIKVGDILPTTKNLTRNWKVNTHISLTRELGVSVGTCMKESVASIVFTAPLEFIKGLLDGYYSVNGLVKNNGIECRSSSLDLIHGISHLLTYFGIFGIINTDTKITTLCIRGEFAQRYAELINTKIYYLPPFDNTNEDDEIYPVERDVYFDRVVSVDYVSATNGKVYDFTVEKTRNFALFNGLNVRDTFHKAGSSENVSVVSKFSELLNATRKPKMQNCFIYFTEGNSTVEELRNTIGSSLVEITMEKIALDFEICIDREHSPWHKTFATLYNNRFMSYSDCISVSIDMEELYKYKLTLEEISISLEHEYGDVACVYSPDSIGVIDVFVDTKTIDLPENRLAFIDHDNVREIYLEEVVLPILKRCIVSGVEGIQQMFFNRDGDKWMVETEGSNFPLLLAHPKVDMKRLLSNNVWDIYNSLGIEAVREFMIEQFEAIMPGINRCHIMLLVDKMTFRGTISSISRYTMRKEESGPMGKASFEETLDNFLKAGLYGQHEPTQGVSASIICGKKPSVGTGLCELKMDMKTIIESESDSETDSETDDDIPITKPSKLVTKPAKPVTKPAKPVTKPAKSVTKPAKPVTKPVTKPAKPVTKPAKSVTKPAKPVTKPVTKPAKPVTKPVTKTAKSVTKPVTKTAKSVTKPAKSVTKPAKPVTKPAKPVTKPVTKPAKPVTKPTTDSDTESESDDEPHVVTFASQKSVNVTKRPEPKRKVRNTGLKK